MNHARCHTCDLVALAKHSSGEWQFDLINGEIYDAEGKPLCTDSASPCLMGPSGSGTGRSASKPCFTFAK